MFHNGQPRMVHDSFCEFARNRKEDFYLTGSRFFGTSHQNSDWDYFVEYSEEIQKELSNFGFIFSGALHKIYKDSNTAMVGVCGDIHIQLVKNAELKKEIQDVLRKYPGFLSNKSKFEMRCFWDMLYEVAKCNIDCK